MFVHFIVGSIQFQFYVSKLCYNGKSSFFYKLLVACKQKQKKKLPTLILSPYVSKPCIAKNVSVFRNESSEQFVLDKKIYISISSQTTNLNDDIETNKKIL